jgi:Domain of unknown function DUF302
MTKRRRLQYAETVETLKDSIAKAGNTIFASIDQSAAAASVGLTLRPMTLLAFGNPKAGTPLMDSFPLVGLDFRSSFLSGKKAATSCSPTRACRKSPLGMASPEWMRELRRWIARSIR